MKQDKIKDFFLKRQLLKWQAGFVLALALTLGLSGASSAGVHVVKEGRIEGVPGFRFENIVYNWDSLFVDVVNMTQRNSVFGRTMVFLDNWGNPVAIARLLPAKVVHESIKRYKGHFVEGTGETARRATRVFWDFGSR